MEFPAGQLIYSRSSAFHTIEVSQSDELRMLRTDQNAVQSALSLSRPQQLNLPYMHAMMAGLLFQPPPASVLMLGLGGGDLVRYLHYYLPGSRLTAVEIDADMVDVCRDYFSLPESEKIDIHIDDAMHFVTHDKHSYDMIMADIYHGTGAPVLLQEKAFFRHCYDRLDENGVLIVNLLTNDADTFRKILWLMRQQFARSTLCLTVPQHLNVIIFAFKQRPVQLSLGSLKENAEELGKRYELDLFEWTQLLFSSNPTVDGKLVFELGP